MFEQSKLMDKFKVLEVQPIGIVLYTGCQKLNLFKLLQQLNFKKLLQFAGIYCPLAIYNPLFS